MTEQEEAKLVLEVAIQAARNVGVSKQAIREVVVTVLAATPNNTYALNSLRGRGTRFLDRLYHSVIAP